MNYSVLTGLTLDGKIYMNEYMGVIEALIPPGSGQTAHAPCLLETDDGDLLAAWFCGSSEGSRDISIALSRLPHNSGAWLPPVIVSNDPMRSEQNPSLFKNPNGEIWLIYTAQLDRQPGKDNMQFTSQVRCRVSLDSGRSWSDYTRLLPEEGSFCRQPIQILSNGRWIFSNWICTDSPDGLKGDPTAFAVSDDKGKAWRRVDMPLSSGRVHANVIELGGGHLIAFMRSRAADFIYRSESFDFGDSWTVPTPTELFNNNSSISAIRLASGRIAIAYNPTQADNPDPNGVAWPGLRCPIAVSLSEDNGKTFPLCRHIEHGEGFIGRENRSNNSQFEYPFLMQAKNGSIHLAFAYRNRTCIKWMCFREEDIIGEKRGSSIYNPTSGQV